nr:MAG TPA: neurohypophysial hormone [Caudoviricetes sp.]
MAVCRNCPPGTDETGQKGIVLCFTQTCSP